MLSDWKGLQVHASFDSQVEIASEYPVISLNGTHILYGGQTTGERYVHNKFDSQDSLDLGQTQHCVLSDDS